MKGIIEESTANPSNENDQVNEARLYSNIEKYKLFTEERAKKLYEGLLVQFLKEGFNEIEASES